MNRLFATANGRRPLAPAFISRIDKWLLLNYPTLWATRIHLFLWYAIIGYAVIYATLLILPDDPHKRSNVVMRQAIVTLLATLGLILWTIYLLRFNTFKRFGQPHALVPGLQLLLFWCMLFIAGFTFVIPPFVEKQKTDAKYTDNDITYAVNQINYCINVLEHEYNPVELSGDTILFTATYEEANSLNRQNDNYRLAPDIDADSISDSTGSISLSARYRPDVRWEPADMKDEWLNSGDTILLLGDSGLVHYIWKNIIYINVKSSGDYSSVRPLTAYQLYHLIYRQKTVSNAEALKTLDSLILKFTGHSLTMEYELKLKQREQSNRGWDYDVNEASNFITNYNVFDFTYHLNEIENAIRYIEMRKYRFERNDYLMWIAVATGYITLALSLLLVAFRHSTLKTFAAALLSGVVISVVTGVALAIVNARPPAIMLTIVIWVMFFHAASLFLYRMRKRSLWTGIALQLAVYSVFCIPICLVTYYYESLHQIYNRYDERYSELYVNEDFQRFLAQWAGLGLLLVMMFLVYGRMFRKWYSQPEE
ncbi:MAG: hypothetical protein MUC87_15885 [Bacteroidia bacterium]|jgi:hypothetical protein|nr:hypothetical protein [Bacteroidia bacterium]